MRVGGIGRGGRGHSVGVRGGTGDGQKWQIEAACSVLERGREMGIDLFVGPPNSWERES